MQGVSAIVLAGGKGTRMGGSIPKVLLKLSGKPIISWVIELLKEVGIEEIVVVTGYKSSLVEKALRGMGDIKFVRQTKQLGTAHGVRVALPYISKDTVLVLFGDDSALYLPQTIKNFLLYHRKKKNKATLLTIKQQVASDIGGLERDNKGRLIGVLKYEDIKARHLEEIEILCGAFCFDKLWLSRTIPLVPVTTSKGEYPLPGLIKLGVSEGAYLDTYNLDDNNQWSSINRPEEFRLAEIKKKEQQ